MAISPKLTSSDGQNTFPPSRPGPRVAIVLPGLGAGGTEHVVSVLANQWAARGWSVTLLTFEPPEAVSYYRFRPDVRIMRLGLPPEKRSHLPALFMSGKRIHLLRQALKGIAPDVAFSFLTRTNVMTLFAARRLGFNVVVSERNNPALQKVGPIWHALRAKLYPHAFGLVTMTSGALQYFAPAMRQRSWVIPNPVDLPEIGERRRGRNILTAVGRLVPQKGFDLLLQAFAKVSPDFPEWTLVIWGEGPDRAALEAERDRLGLRGRVEMPGVTTRPGLWVDTADAFVLSSRYEGWGIALLEAMAADLPVVSFDCEWGPREMIDDERTGLLVEPGNVDALAGALDRLLGDENLRKRLGAAAGLSARRFTPQRIMEQWDEVARAALAIRCVEGESNGAIHRGPGAVQGEKSDLAMRMVIVQAGLGAGGAEKIVNMLAHHRLGRGDKVDVIAVNAISRDSFFPYDDAIATHALGGSSGSGFIGNFIRLRRLRRLLKELQPQLVVSFLTKINVMVGIATIGRGTATIMSERNNFAVQKMHPIWRLLARVTLGRAAKLVMQTEMAQASLPGHVKNRAVVIANPVTPTPFNSQTQREQSNFVAVGRLEWQKGFDLLLEAFAQAARKLPSASLVIFGDGPERPALEQLADRLGISDRVRMPGTTRTPQEWLESGGIFVLSSRFEGFPNVLLEALFAGMATISFDCPWGPSDILRNGEDYPLVPAADVDALAEALVRVASEPEVKQRLEGLGPRVAARFSKAPIFAQWDRLIERVVTPDGNVHSGARVSASSVRKQVNGARPGDDFSQPSGLRKSRAVP